MCRKSTIRLTGLVVLAASAAMAQTAWRRVGGSTVDLGLASPATGPVDRVWFAPDGARILARTTANRIFETTGGETWSAASADAQPPDRAERAAARMPESGVLLTGDPSGPGNVFALGNHVYRSADGGRSWTNLTAAGTASVIGAGQRDVAVSPHDPDLVLVANDFGVWRSTDGGLSWSGLNQELPNLAIRRIVSTPRGLRGARVHIDGVGEAEQLPGAGPEWRIVRDSAVQLEIDALRAASRQVGAEVSAVAGEQETRYAGGSNGALWVSLDAGRSWRAAPAAGAISRVERIWTDPEDPRLALAVLTGKGLRVLRTANTGVTWEDWTANLPEGAIRGLAVDHIGRAVYVAGERGVFLHRGDLDGPASSWTPVAGLPAAPAWDVQLDPAANQVYIALDGYGLVAAAAPHRAGMLRLVNAADFSDRPAAPGSLLSVLGGRVARAQAGDRAAPVLDATEGESQIQVPFEAIGTALPLSLETSGRTVNLGIPLQSVSPAIFVDRDGAPMLLDGDSGMLLDARNRARSGGRLQILATGLGRVRPDWPTGLAAPLDGAPAVRAEVKAYLDRVPVQVTRATLAPGYIGFYLIEVWLPALINAGPAEFFLTADGQESNRVRLYLEP
jgi:uncharacterized protein (TIGR03437 family)